MSIRRLNPDQETCIACNLHIGGIRASRIILWLAAITIVSFIIGSGIVLLSAGFPPAPGQTLSPFRHEALLAPATTTIPLDGATTADVKLTLGAGELVLTGGAPDTTLLDANVFSASSPWQSEIVQDVTISRKSVTITERQHKSGDWFAMESHNRWEIDMNDKVPTRLDIRVGAGKSRITLGTLNLEALSVHNGAGTMTIDLSGYHGGRFDAAIKNGIGDLAMYIPRESNTRVRVSQGIGDIKGNGFVQTGDTFVTPAFNASLAVNEITLNQGVGSITLETV